MTTSQLPLLARVSSNVDHVIYLFLGTFSTVYKAIDVRHYQRDNQKWLQGSRQDTYDASRLLALITALESTMPTRAKKRVINSRLNQCLKDFVIKTYMPSFIGDSIDLDSLRELMMASPPVFVAIKRINATSGPKRIAEELSFLRDLDGLHYVVPLITAHRWEDQVLVVNPYFYSIDFRVKAPLPNPKLYGLF